MSGFGGFASRMGSGLNIGGVLSTAATIGGMASNAMSLGNTIGQHQRNLNLSLNLFGQKQQAEEDEIKKNISIVIPLEYSSREKLYCDKDGQDEEDWHYIVARDVNEARDKLKRYLGKTKADNIILDTHAGIDNRASLPKRCFQRSG